MASYLGFSLTYPYQREARNPTNGGRGVGRGSCVSDMRVSIWICDVSDMDFVLLSIPRFREFIRWRISSLRNSRSAKDREVCP